MTMRSSFLLIPTLAAAVACGSSSRDGTTVKVAVFSDFRSPAEMDAIRIDITGTRATSRSFPQTSTGDPDTDKPRVTLDLVPTGANDAGFTVEAIAMLGPSTRVSQSARVAFVPGKVVLLKLRLGKDCLGKPCGAGLTCSFGQCVGIVVESLPPYTDPITAPMPPTIDGSATTGEAGSDILSDGIADAGGGARDASDVADTPTADAADSCARNACGGCSPLPQTVNGACQCGGKWTCQGENTLVCTGSTPQNECGGCTTLSGKKGDACGCGGKLSCDSSGKLTCTGENRPSNYGKACGCQQRGTVQCDGSCNVSNGDGCTPNETGRGSCAKGGTYPRKCQSDCTWKLTGPCPCDNMQCDHDCDGSSGVGKCICDTCDCKAYCDESTGKCKPTGCACCESDEKCCAANGYCIPEAIFSQGCS
jgi:hypothetical protein